MDLCESVLVRAYVSERVESGELACVFLFRQSRRAVLAYCKKSFAVCFQLSIMFSLSEVIRT